MNTPSPHTLPRWHAAQLANLGLGILCLVAAAFPAHNASAAASSRELRQQERQRVNIYNAYFPNLKTARKAAISFHDKLLESHYAEGFLVLELDGSDAASLISFGFRFEPATEFIARRNGILQQIDVANAVRKAKDPNAADIGIQAIPNFSCYESLKETFTAAQQLAMEFPAIARWLVVGDSWEKTQGLGGYDMGVLKLTNASVAASNKPVLFVNSAIHAREYATAPLALAFARWLVYGYGRNADATWILDHHEVHLMLQANPDGRKKAEAGIDWRKNTNTNYCAAYGHLQGADLNRNFSYSWNSINSPFSSNEACSFVYRGPGPASEPEVQAIQNYMHSLWPDRRGPSLTDAAPLDVSGLHLDIHSFGEMVLWPWAEIDTPSPNATSLQTLGRRFAFYNRYTPQHAYGLYPHDGTSHSASYGDLGVPAYTFELGNTFFQDCSTFNEKILPDNLPALIYAAKVTRAPYLTPSGPDVVNLSLSPDASSSSIAPGTPVTITAWVTDTRFNQDNGIEPIQPISAAEAYIDVPPWANGAQAIPLVATSGTFSKPGEGVTGTLATGGLSHGRHIVFVRGRDSTGQFGPVSAVFLNVR